MAQARVERRLAAILVADVVGYSRLVGLDEEGTIARLKALHNELIDPGIAQHQGRIVKTMGDGILVEFASVVDAVRWAVEVQQAMTEREDDVPDDRSIRYRVGINLGDIVVEGDDILGDGVNIAARLESIAEPGSVFVSGSVYEQVEGKLALQFDDLGERGLKNIAKPVRIYRIRVSDGKDAAGKIDLTGAVPGFGGMPAIAVLPFDNLSGDPDQEHFADGIADDILTRLSMWRWMPVIARNSSFVFRGKSVDIKQVGRELGARYILEGSVRRAGNRVRVVVQLIDATTAHHEWAERYDRELKDVFALQDEITEKIVTSLEPTLGKAEIRRARSKDPTNLDAWETVHRALWFYFRFTRDDINEAIRLLQKAVELDPNFSPAHAWLAAGYHNRLLLGWADNPAEAVQNLCREAKIAVALDDNYPMANAAAGMADIITRNYDTGLGYLARAIELNPSYAFGHFVQGVALTFAGRPKDSVRSIEKGFRLSPNDTLLVMWLSALSLAYYQSRDYESAREVADVATQRSPHYPLAQRAHASALAQLGRLKEARAALAKFLELAPGYTYEGGKASFPFRNSEDLDHSFEGIRKAGWDG